MIEKMKFITVTGPKGDLDRVVNSYLTKYDIHLENALTELKDSNRLIPFIQENPYKDLIKEAKQLLSLLPENALDSAPAPLEISIQKAVECIERMGKELKQLEAIRDPLIRELEEKSTSLKVLIPFEGLNYDISSILHFQYVKFRFGRVKREHQENFEKHVYGNVETIFIQCHGDDDYIYGVYFSPEKQTDRIDAIYASIHFERIFISDEYKGTPAEAHEYLTREVDRLSAQLNEVQEKINLLVMANQNDLLAAYHQVETVNDNFDIRKMAACTDDKENPFYILCGWMPAKDEKMLSREVEGDENLYLVVEENHDELNSHPPTKLKNPRIFRPFEMFIQMYGLPDYKEFDPTVLVAITYSFLFGFMFGDVGQGLCLTVFGYLLYKVKKINLAAIIACAGIFSTFFGFMFGSFFGFEEVIHPLWLHPASHMTNLPFIGNLNTVFITAIALGMGLILLTMLLHMLNAFRVHDAEGIYFDANGLAGFIFYGSALAVILLFMTGRSVPGALVLILMFGLPLLVIALKEPLTAIVEKKAEVMPKEKGMFIVQSFFELFELLLSYFSNTLSFVRVGAFAVSHAAMMEVVLMLAGAENGGTGNLLVIILGNLFVCGMEGLIVGIQVLRLEYYELFSRFYKGGGRAFKPYFSNR